MLIVIILSVVMLNVVMLSVWRRFNCLASIYKTTYKLLTLVILGATTLSINGLYTTLSIKTAREPLLKGKAQYS
jgi:hypothetical protein